VRKLIVSEFVSIDGVMEAPGGEEGYVHTGWVFDHFGPEQEQYKLQEVLDAESQLLGRRTYEGFAAAWPGRGGEFADKMNGMPKHVASTTLHGELDWNATALEGDAVEAVRELKRGDGGPILVAGSRTLVQALLPAGLVDELRLMVFPVILGSGARLYPESPEKLSLQLADTVTFRSGVTVLTYHPA
jgi:dihydrofolate reductase